MRIRLLPLVLLVATTRQAASQIASPGDWKVAITDTRESVARDFNQDGTVDSLVRREGNSNCVYGIFDGATETRLGEIEASLVVVRARRLNAWPVIQTWVHMGAGAGLYSTWVYDGHEYVNLAQVPVEGEGMEQLFGELDRIPAGSP